MSWKRKSTQNSDEEPESKRSRTRRNKNEQKINGEDSDVSTETTQNGRAGRILQIYLKNFMCHSSLEINLNHNVNYIIGRNGSGKSAILTALIVGLGGKAILTNRGSSMKAFIKVGQASATVEITLSNDGPMAYKPKVFGNKITVVRIFNETGGSRYKLKAENGEVITTLLRDVRRLAEALNIQVDNPVCILNQDVARTFLNTNNTTKKYQMFMKATNLENINEQYNIGLNNKRATIETLNKRKRNLDDLKSESDKWLKKVRVLESINELEERKKQLQIEIMWTKVYHLEDEFKEIEQELNQYTDEVQKLESINQDKDKCKRNLQENKEQTENQLKEIRQEEENNQALLNNVKSRLQKLNEQMFTKGKLIDSLKQMIKRKNDDRQNIETELSNAESSQPNKQQILLERTKKIDDLQNKLVSIIDLINTTENDISQNRNALSHKLVDVKNIKEEMSHVDGKIAQRKAQIRSLKSEEDNSIAVYGRHMPKLLNAINAHKEQFSQLPRGPIGSYIKLKDKKWALAIEEFIGFGMLQSFCVNNSRDSQVLSKIFDSIFTDHPKPTIICSKFFTEVHDISKYKTAVPNNCIALIDSLRISDPVITNCLIDQLSIETILLTPTSDLCMRLMSQACNVPKNCTRTITLKGDQFYPDPAYRSYAGRQKVAKYLQVNASELIRQYEAELKTFTDNSQSISSQARGLRDDIVNFENTIKQLEEKITSLNRAKLKVQGMIEELKMEELPTEKNYDILREELQEIDKYIEIKTQEINGIKQQIESCTSDLREVESEISGLKQISKELNERMMPLITQLDETNVKLKQIDVDARCKADRFKSLKEKLKTVTSVSDKKKEEIESMKNCAEELGPQPASKRSTEEVLSEVDEVDQNLKEINNIMGEANFVRITYEKINKKYKQVKLLVEGVQISVDEMSSSLDYRARQYHRLTNQIGCRVREMFTCVLQIRQFKGTLEINHDQKTLELIVVPQHGSQNSNHKHILSGGERSYSTVAFLMALWQVMEYPFYFLDEFDVFMDKVNRRAVMDMLLEHGLDHNNLQFVFLTPQDISSVKTNENVTIHRMEDPERKELPKR